VADVKILSVHDTQQNATHEDCPLQCSQKPTASPYPGQDEAGQ
jgi:hypothetical protein